MPIPNCLTEAYEGFYEKELEGTSNPRREANALILSHSPRERLEIYLQWNGILGFTSQIFAIATEDFA